MSAQSPQRRRPVPSAVVAQSQRDTSRSPSMRGDWDPARDPTRDSARERERPRALKTQSMPLVPFAHPQSSPQQPGQAIAQQAQGSPISIQNSVQGAGGQVTRLLPTPPHPLPLPAPMDPEVLHSGGSQHSPPQPQGQQGQGQTVTHYPRPIRMPPAPFLAKYQHQGQGDEDRWSMTEELLMDIERADLEANAQQQMQGAQGISQVQPQAGQHVNGGQHNVNTNGSPHIPSQQTHSPHSSLSSTSSMSPHHPSSSSSQPQSTSLPTTPSSEITSNAPVDRLRGLDRSSPKEPPKVPVQLKNEWGWRRPSSPLALAAPLSMGTPERRGSPLVRASSPLVQVHSSGSGGGSPGVRRVTQQQTFGQGPQASQGQVQPVRTPDRSLPVQEEAEDEHHLQLQQQQQHLKHHQLAHHHSQVHNHNQLSQQQQIPGRTPPLQQLAQQRASPAREGDDGGEEESEGEGDGEEGSYTPRSPSVSLPEVGMGQGPQGYYTQHLQAHPGLAQSYQQQQNQHAQQQQSQRAELSRRSTVTGVSELRNAATRGRNGSLDGVVGMRGIDGALEREREKERERERERDRDRESRERESRERQPTQPSQYPPQQAYRAFSDPYPSKSNSSSRQQYPEEQYLDELTSTEASYIQSYLRSPRPEAPVPPTPHSQTGPSPSPYPLPPMLKANSVQGENVNGDRPDPSPSPYDLTKDFSPIVPVGSPYPYPFTHVRRVPQVGPNRPHYPSALGNGLSAALDPTHPQAIQEQMAKQLQMYAQNHNAENGNITDSTFSPASTPFPQGGGGYYDPWVYLHMKRTFGAFGGEVASIRSSPSHEPVPLPPAPVLAKARKAARKNGMARTVKPPPRVESTQPRETSPELSSSGDETAGEEYVRNVSRGEWNGVVGTAGDGDEDGEGEWVDEDEVDGDEEDLLQLEYHPTFVRNVEKRRRRWESGWETLVQAFRTLDRQTDATMVLLASPSHTTKLHTIRSRSIRREAFIAHSSAMREIKRNFKLTSSARRNTRTHTSSLVDRFLASAGNEVSGDSSDGSDKSREEDLKRALETALGSLGTLGSIYEQREARWAEEMRRVREERERVELLLRQVLGEHHAIVNNGNGV